MANWGLVATVKAPEVQVLAFVAHHLSLGATHLWIYFDDPDDPAFATIAALPRVTATLCTDAYWQAHGGRHDRHQNRQARNAKETHRACPLLWIGHIDVDEFLHPARPMADLLDDLPDDTLTLRMEPFEAMHEPALPDDIFTARRFRGALKDAHAALRPQVLGLYRAVVPQGMLSHTVGKSFCRTGIKGLNLRLHGAFLGRQRISTPFHPDLALLHFHGQDRAAWLAALPFRLTRGAYQYTPKMQAHLAAGPDVAVQAFYDGTQILQLETADLLGRAGRLISADLGLRVKVQALLTGTLP